MNDQSNRKAIELPVFLGVLGGALIIAALIVAFVVNPIELAEHFASVDLSWDPTHTARKYLWMAVLFAGGAYYVYRNAYRPTFVALLPALMLTIAVPIGAAGYESVANRWSFAAWMAYGEDLEELRKDPYVYLSEPDGDAAFAVRIRPDILEGLQWMRASGFQSDWGLLDEMEAEADARTVTGWILLLIFGGLTGGAGWLIYRDRSALFGSATQEPPAEPL